MPTRTHKPAFTASADKPHNLIATSLSGPSAASKTGAPSQHATTRPPETHSLPSPPSSPSHSGQVESRPCPDPGPPSHARGRARQGFYQEKSVGRLHAAPSASSLRHQGVCRDRPQRRPDPRQLRGDPARGQYRPHHCRVWAGPAQTRGPTKRLRGVINGRDFLGAERGAAQGLGQGRPRGDAGQFGDSVGRDRCQDLVSGGTTVTCVAHPPLGNAGLGPLPRTGHNPAHLPVLGTAV